MAGDDPVAAPPPPRPLAPSTSTSDHLAETPRAYHFGLDLVERSDELLSVGAASALDRASTTELYEFEIWEEPILI